jgi:hypothetical protein
MARKIQLQVFDENFRDYYDREKDAFVIFAGNKYDDFLINTHAEIVDFDGKSWICWLYSLDYDPAINAYKLEYKTL